MIKKIPVTIFLLIISVAATLAQINPEQALLNARKESSDIKNRSIELERMKRDANEINASKNNEPKFPQIKQDFEQIQKLSSNIFKLTAVKTKVNYKSVFKFVSELHRRAARLKSNLFTAKIKENKDLENKKQIVGESQNIKILLDVLDNSINSFVHNSMFLNIHIINTDDSLKAQKDLETVIEASSLIKEKTKMIMKNDSDK